MPLHFVAWRQRCGSAVWDGIWTKDFFYSFGGVPTLLVANASGALRRQLDAAQVEHVKEKIFLAHLRDAKLILPVVEFARSVAKTHPVTNCHGRHARSGAASLESAA